MSPIRKRSTFGPFLGHFGHFLPNLGQTRIFPKNRVPSLLCPYGPLTSCTKSEKTNEPFPRKNWKCPFLGDLGPFCPIWAKREFSQENWLSLFYLYGLLTSCKVSEKNIKRFTSNDHLKNPAIWLVESFEPKNSRTRFFPDMGLVPSDVVPFGLSSVT